jgi:hypothetical protein
MSGSSDEKMHVLLDALLFIIALTEHVGPKHSTATSLLHCGKQPGNTPQGVGCISDDAQLPCTPIGKVFGNLRKARSHENEIVEVIHV